MAPASRRCKILSRITPPTRGEIRLRGRVAALLEVGTGFHRELTGRENIFLNGAKWDVACRESAAASTRSSRSPSIEKFLDTPVKRYSSGMYVRLAFAVAAHLRPEILVVDEVLAVGDAAFQKKCLGKMEDVASGGRTVLFVSHDMAAVTRLCSRAILLTRGQADPRRPCRQRRRGVHPRRARRLPGRDRLRGRARVPGDEHARLLAARVIACDEQCRRRRPPARPRGQLDYEVLAATTSCLPEFHNEDGTCVFASNDSRSGDSQVAASGRYRATVEIPGNTLGEGMYWLTLAMSTYEPVIVHFVERGVLAFQVHDPDRATAHAAPTWASCPE